MNVNSLARRFLRDVEPSLPQHGQEIATVSGPSLTLSTREVPCGSWVVFEFQGFLTRWAHPQDTAPVSHSRRDFLPWFLPEVTSLVAGFPRQRFSHLWKCRCGIGKKKKTKETHSLSTSKPYTTERYTVVFAQQQVWDNKIDCRRGLQLWNHRVPAPIPTNHITPVRLGTIFNNSRSRLVRMTAFPPCPSAHHKNLLRATFQIFIFVVVLVCFCFVLIVCILSVCGFCVFVHD